MSKEISILGCGWLGLPLAEVLISKNYSIKGSTTSLDKLEILKGKKIKAYHLIAKTKIEGNISDFLNSEIIIINIPPSKHFSSHEDYKKMITHLIDEINKSKINKVIFISATSVYPLENKEVKEEDAVYGGSKRSSVDWLEVEDLFRNEAKFKTTILRFSGLMGGDYQPGRWVSGKEINGANSPMNMIHREDCIEIIHQVIKQNIWNETFNASAEVHPTREEFYNNACEFLGIEKPIFLNGELPFRIVNSEKLKNKLNYHFLHPDPSLYFK